jgi:hypothetical protein
MAGFYSAVDKIARTAWAVLATGETYHQPAPVDT